MPKGSEAGAVVIGGGINGLVAGAVLARHKIPVTVIEQRPNPGGAAVTAELAPGFHVPRLSHALGPLRRDVIRALRLDRAGIEFIRPDPSLTTFGAHGETITFHPDPVLTAAAINARSARDAGRWREFLKTIQHLASFVADLNRHRPPSIDRTISLDTWRVVRLARRARKMGGRDLALLARLMPTAISDFLDDWFETDLLKGAIAARAIFGNYAGPRSGGTGAMLLQRLADDPSPVGSGVTARGGPGALSAAIAGVAANAGARIRTDARVTRILIARGRVTGVVLDSGEEIGARAVVSAVDPRQTFLRLVEPDDLSPTFLERIRNYRARGVTAKINLALSGMPTFTALHGDAVPLRGRLLIAPGLDYLERAFDAAKYGEMSPAPWLEIAMPAVVDRTLAPEGHHVMSIYAHAAPRHLRQGDWGDQRETLFQNVMNVLSQHAPDVETLVLHREILTPEDLERIWGISGGHIFHGDSALDQSWLARPVLGHAQYRTPIEGLYLGSAGTHPGGGLTGGSGLLAGMTAVGDLKKRS